MTYYWRISTTIHKMGWKNFLSQDRKRSTWAQPTLCNCLCTKTNQKQKSNCTRRRGLGMISCDLSEWQKSAYKLACGLEMKYSATSRISSLYQEILEKFIHFNLKIFSERPEWRESLWDQSALLRNDRSQELPISYPSLTVSARQLETWVQIKEKSIWNIQRLHEYPVYFRTY